jgi:N6-L-threonylcarbamoyladenine synthase
VRAATREGANGIVLSGGVAANGELRRVLKERSSVPVFVPPPVLCTDNGAMVAACAAYRFEAGSAGLELDALPGLPVA